ncbi:DEAD/DEAH box helicase [Bacillus timonensis]|nr:DEAD/DEAH box helicase [Bacillus timonensis]
MTEATIEKMAPFLQKGWEKAGFDQPTAIQSQAIPLIEQGKDVLAESPTGTGKTLAYLLPLLSKIEVEQKELQAVILASSHELVMQIHQEIQKWGEGSGITSGSFIGGANLKRQLEKLKKRPQIVVGTPGRLLELIKQKKLKMHTVKTIVLDEGDQLLVPEHIHTVNQVVKSSLKDRQVVLFSATLPEATEQAARELMDDPVLVKVTKEQVDTPEVEHIYFVSENRDKIQILEKLSRLDGMNGFAFLNDIGELAVAAEKLAYKNIDIVALHSELKKQDRAKVIQSFKAGKYPILLTTDVAARGLDVAGLAYVIHVDFPKELTQYIHRSGRTGRMGSTSGTVISIVTPREERNLKQFARKLGVTVHKKRLSHGKIVESK